MLPSQTGSEDTLKSLTTPSAPAGTGVAMQQSPTVVMEGIKFLPFSCARENISPLITSLPSIFLDNVRVTAWPPSTLGCYFLSGSNNSPCRFLRTFIFSVMHQLLVYFSGFFRTGLGKGTALLVYLLDKLVQEWQPFLSFYVFWFQREEAFVYLNTIKRKKISKISPNSYGE